MPGEIISFQVAADGTLTALRGRDRLLVRVDDVRRARTTLANAHIPDLTTGLAANNSLELQMAGETPLDAAWINRLLVEADVAVHELRPDQRTLEQVFLDLTTQV